MEPCLDTHIKLLCDRRKKKFPAGPEREGSPVNRSEEVRSITVFPCVLHLVQIICAGKLHAAKYNVRVRVCERVTVNFNCQDVSFNTVTSSLSLLSVSHSVPPFTLSLTSSCFVHRLCCSFFFITLSLASFDLQKLKPIVKEEMRRRGIIRLSYSSFALCTEFRLIEQKGWADERGWWKPPFCSRDVCLS